MMTSESRDSSRPYRTARPGRRRTCSSPVAIAESMELRRLLSATSMSGVSVSAATGSTGVAEPDVVSAGTPIGDNDVSLSPVYGPVEQKPMQLRVRPLDAGAWPASLSAVFSDAESATPQSGIPYGPVFPDFTPLYGPFVAETISAQWAPLSNNSGASDADLYDHELKTTADSGPGLTWRRSDVRVSGFRAVADKSPLEIIRDLAMINTVTRKVNPEQTAAVAALERRPSESRSLAWNAAEAAESNAESPENNEPPQFDAEIPVAQTRSQPESVPSTFAELLSLDSTDLENAGKAGAGSLLPEDLRNSRTGKSSWETGETPADRKPGSLTNIPDAGLRNVQNPGSRRATTEQRSRPGVPKPIKQSPRTSASIGPSNSGRRKSKPAEASDFSVDIRKDQFLDTATHAESLWNDSTGELSVPGTFTTESSQSKPSQEAGHDNNSTSEIRRVSHEVPQNHANVAKIVIRPGNFSQTASAAGPQSISSGHSVISAAASENRLAADLGSERDDSEVSEDEWWTDAPLIMPQPSRGR